MTITLQHATIMGFELSDDVRLILLWLILAASLVSATSIIVMVCKLIADRWRWDTEVLNALRE